MGAPFRSVLYDTIQAAVSATAVSYSFFNVVQGGLLVAGTTKTPAHTNMVQPRMLENNRTFQVEGMFMGIRELSSAAALPLYLNAEHLNNGWIEIKLSDKRIPPTWPCHMIPDAGSALNYFSNITAAATEYHVNHGVPAVQNVRPVEFTILPQATLEVVLTIPVVATAVLDVFFAFVGWETLAD
jgi:hypothetical protein